jgi:hypothetical protein
MQRIVIEVKAGCIVNVIGTTEDISVEILDYDWDEGVQHSINGVDLVKTDQEITDYISQETTKENEEEEV